MSFGDVIRSAAAQGTLPVGIGGDANTIWNHDRISDYLYELSTTDLSAVRSASSPGGQDGGIGGDANTIWYTEGGTTDKIYELSTVDFSIIRSIDYTSDSPTGIGGDANTIWFCTHSSNYIKELSTTDLSTIRQSGSPSSHPRGIGGDANTIWHASLSSPYLIYELSITDFSVIRNADPPDAQCNIGGNYNTIWFSNATTDLIYELDADPPTYTISGNVKDSDGTNLNNVTMILVNSTGYSTSTNASGNYSQVVDPDVYTVTASLTGYLDSSASVDSSAGDQTQDFTLLKPVISGNVKNSNGANLPSVAISLEDDIDYSTTTDINGDYSQTVDTDIYDVIASILGNQNQSAIVDATLSNQTHDFVFPVTTAPHDKAIRLEERYLLE